MASQIQDWEAVGDRRAIFLRCYAMTTDHALAAVHDGSFRDPDWMLQLLEHFADYYFLTLEPHAGSSPRVPPAWQTAHRLAAQAETTACEALLLGVNAHINNDLPQAVFDTLARDWPLSFERIGDRHEDFCVINEVIAETMDDAQREIVEPFDHALAAIDHELRPVMQVAEWEMHRVITGWRAEVWQHAISLLTVSGEQERVAIVEQIERSAAQRAHLFTCEIEMRELLVSLPARELRHLFPGHAAEGCRLESSSLAGVEVIGAAWRSPARAQGGT